MAGPIVRYRSIAAQIEERITTPKDFHYGIQRFIQGFSKKIILANQLGIVCEESFATEQPTIFLAWLGAVAFALEIYYDFSGYSDMAVGLGKLFGFHFMENFNLPYVSSSFTEYWKRTHISLSQWFRDYVYIPLGGSRVSATRLFFNQLIIWLLTGFWHGASFQFVAWGLWQFFFLSLENYVIHPEQFTQKRETHLYRFFTLTMLTIGLVFFGETSTQGAIHHVYAMFGAGDFQILFLQPPDVYLLLRFWHILFLGLFFALKDWREPDPDIIKITSKLSPTMKEALSTGYYLVALVISVSYLAVDAHNPFIYFNF